MFNETKFLNNLKKKSKFSFTRFNPNGNYLYLRNSFSKIVKKHAVEKLGGGGGGGVRCDRNQPREKSLPILKEHEHENILFALPYFNFALL